MRRSKLLSLFLCSAFLSSLAHAAPADPRDNGKTAAMKADEAYRKSLELTHPKPTPLQQYEKAMEPIRNLEIQQATSAIQKDPKDAAAYFKRAEAYYAKKEYKQALPDYDKALELDPKMTKVYPRRATVYFLLGNYEKSQADVKEADRNKVEVLPQFRKALEDSMKGGSKPAKKKG